MKPLFALVIILSMAPSASRAQSSDLPQTPSIGAETPAGTSIGGEGKVSNTSDNISSTLDPKKGFAVIHISGKIPLNDGNGPIGAVKIHGNIRVVFINNDYSSKRIEVSGSGPVQGLFKEKKIKGKKRVTVPVSGEATVSGYLQLNSCRSGLKGGNSYDCWSADISGPAKVSGLLP